jgi:hypothetical protein
MNEFVKRSGAILNLSEIVTTLTLGQRLIINYAVFQLKIRVRFTSA